MPVKKIKPDQKEIKKQVNRLMKCMNFTAKKMDSRSKDASIYYDIYQMLGCAWEFVARDCIHEIIVPYSHDSLRCKNCGKIIYNIK